MDEKKKKTIYIAIIVVCMGVTAFFLFFMNGSSGGGTSIDLTQVPVNHTATPAGGTSGTAGAVPTNVSEIEFGAPAVFPASNKFNTAALDSSKIRSLHDYTPVRVAPEEQGRDNPFTDF